ncbi:hypothetical protein Fot_15645 [Forsythia ovata]|uniref:Uncharacterized protein n=1 Tax=Forsythia ovata TaxID=205694 RepID=A0ABD1WA13_9LAMI
MVMGTERSKALHNFTMPCGLRWGNQRYLRCMKVNSNSQMSTLRRSNANDSDSSDYQHQPHSSQQRHTTRVKERDSNGSHKMGPKQVVESFGGGRRFENGDDDGIAAIREKVMFDLQAVADKMKDQILKEGLEEGEAPLSGSVAGTTAGGSDSGKALTVDVMKPSSALSPMRTPSTGDNKSPLMRISVTGAVESPSGEKRERAKFSVPLLRREIEEDFMAMVGHRPPRRPKKRAKIVQKELDTLFPGLWLSEITPDMYKVPEAAP